MMKELILMCVLIAAIGGVMFSAGGLSFFGAIKIFKDDTTSRMVGIIILAVGLLVIFTAAAVATV
ncbi:MAG: hypothetical protein WC470_01480 [Candidatus Paceibacterota bacterium]